jgi:hypothetical protein
LDNEHTKGAAKVEEEKLEFTVKTGNLKAGTFFK